MLYKLVHIKNNGEERIVKSELSHERAQGLLSHFKSMRSGAVGTYRIDPDIEAMKKDKKND